MDGKEKRIRAMILILFFFMRKSGSHPDEATSRACALSSRLVKMNVATGLKIILAVFLWCVEAPYGGELRLHHCRFGLSDFCG